MNKNFFTVFLCLCVVLCNCVVYAQEVDNNAIEFYVSCIGNDANSGTYDKPFLTLEKAQEAVRMHTKNMNSDIIVNILSGMYFQDKTFTLTEKDSGNNSHKVIYRSLDGAIVSGGLKLTGWQQHQDNIYKISVPQSYNDRYITGLYINGKQKTRAKSEKRIVADGYYCDPSDQTGNLKSGFVFSNSGLENFQNTQDIELGWSWQWRYAVLPVEKTITNKDNKVEVIFKQPDFSLSNALNSYNSYQSMEFDVFNAYELMDKEGEFYYNRQEHILYYYKSDDENLDDALTIIPNLDKVLEIKGENNDNKAQNIEIDGITFCHTVSDERTREYIHNPHQANQIEDFCFDESYNYPQQSMGVRAGIWLNYGDNISFSNNVVCQMQGAGVGIYDGVTNSQIEGNVFYELSSSAITAGLPIHEYASLEKDGLTNISSRKNVTSSEMLPHSNGKNLPIRVTKGDYTNSYYVSKNEKNWIQIDLEQAHRIKKVILVGHEEGNFAVGTRMNIDIQGSNSPDFAEYSILTRQTDNVEDFPWKGNLEKEINDPNKYRYIRIEKKDLASFIQAIVLTDDMNGLKMTPPTTNCKITNNYINDTCEFYIAACPIEIYYVADYEVSHNEIYNAPYTSIQFGWGWARGKCDFAKNNKINYNRLENGMLKLKDGGHIYMLGPQPNSQVLGNYLNGTFYGPGGIYPDNGSSGWDIAQNVVERVDFSFHPWATDSDHIAIHNNYVSAPNYRLGATESYIKDNEIFVRNNPPLEAQKIINNSGLLDEYKNIVKKYENKTNYYWEKSYSADEITPIGCPDISGLITEVNSILKIIDMSNLYEKYPTEIDEFKEEYNEILTQIKKEQITLEEELLNWEKLNKLVETFTKGNVFKNGYSMLKYSDGLKSDSATIPTVENGIVDGSLFVNDVENFKIPIISDSKINKEDGNFTLANMGVKNIYYTACKFKDVMFEFDFMYKYALYDFPGFVLRGKDPTSYMETQNNCGYSFNFGDRALDVQRFNGGKRTVVFGNAENVTPLSGVKKLDLPMLSYDKPNHFKVGAFNVENGVRLYLEINGTEIFDYVDTTDGRIEDAGYFSFLAPFSSIEVGTDKPNKIFDDIETVEWAKPYICILASNDIINGKENRKFAPLDNVTVEEFCTMVKRAFKDIDNSELLLSLNLNEKDELSREDAAFILYNAMKKLCTYTGELCEPEFSIEKVSDYAQNAVYELGRMKLLSGDENKNFNPKNKINRAQCAKLIFLSMQYK